VKGLQWTVSANRLEVADSGALVRFERGVTMTLTSIGEAASLSSERRAQ
jgi:hypothetical protein